MSTDRLRTLDAAYILSKHDPKLATSLIEHVNRMNAQQQLAYADFVLKSRERYCKGDDKLIPYCLYLLSQGMQNGYMCSILQLENICSFLVDGGDEVCYCSCRTLFVASSFCVINFGCVGSFGKRPIEFAVEALRLHYRSQAVTEALFMLIERCLPSSCNMLITSQANVVTGLINTFKCYFYKTRWLASKALKLLSQFILHCQVEQDAVMLHLKFFVRAARVCSDDESDMDCLYRVRGFMGPNPLTLPVSTNTPVSVSTNTGGSPVRVSTNTGGTHC
jgi:hypothetical protein